MVSALAFAFKFIRPINFSALKKVSFPLSRNFSTVVEIFQSKNLFTVKERFHSQGTFIQLRNFSTV